MLFANKSERISHSDILWAAVIAVSNADSHANVLQSGPSKKKSQQLGSARSIFGFQAA